MSETTAPWDKPAAGAIPVLELWPHQENCYICENLTLVRWGIAIYEDEIVPDDHQGEWGGVSVCMRCFYLVRGIQEYHAGRTVPLWFPRKLVSCTLSCTSADSTERGS